jgi:hypothetical protein
LGGGRSEALAKILQSPKNFKKNGFFINDFNGLALGPNLESDFKPLRRCADTVGAICSKTVGGFLQRRRDYF